MNNKGNHIWKILNELNIIDLIKEEVNCLGVTHIFKESNVFADYVIGCTNREESLGAGYS